MNLHIGKEKWNQAAAFYVRMEVFVLERSIPLQEEFDTEDTDSTVYVVLYDNDRPVATGRFLTDESTIRPGRIAVVSSHRKQGLGRVIVNELEKIGKQQNYSQSVIHGELSAAPFYEKLGYQVCSDVFYEDGAPCVELQKKLF